MISVIAPNFNEPLKHIYFFIVGLLNQTFTDFEVIIVDGGSTNKSVDFIKEFKDQLNITVLVDKTRNFGYIRNLGASHAKGNIMFHANTDNYFEPELLEKVDRYYREHPEAISVSGRVFPLGTNIIAHVAYQLFDFLRFIFTCAPMPIKKYRPSGNFMTVKTSVFRQVGGHPEVRCNEDGLFGQRLDPYASKEHKAVVFNLKFYVGHWVKKFEEMGGVQAVFFYFYTLGNFFPLLQPLLKPTLAHAEFVFEGRHPKRLGVNDLVKAFWNWL